VPAHPHLHHGSNRPALAGRRRRCAFTLVEVMIAFVITGLVFATVTSQLVESAKLSLHITRTLEHSRNARELIDTLSADIRAAQILRLHSTFANRSTVARDGQPGNYLVLHFVDAHGVITRTVGYYLVALKDAEGWALYRHDSSLGDSVAGELPASGTAGHHRLIKRAVRLPDANELFRCARDRGVSLQGEFGAAGTRDSERTEYIRCTIYTRS
jgi:type II secretory pathway pseudopilin PulG